MCFALSEALAREDGWCFSVSASFGTLPLTRFRNDFENTLPVIVVTEMGYALLALASLVEAAVRIPITLLTLAFVVLATPVVCCMSQDPKKVLFDLQEEKPMAYWPLAIGFTVFVNISNAASNLIALFQNIYQGENDVEYDQHLMICDLRQCCTRE